ncbi:1,4-alpha-glucan branching protein GlgB [Anaerolineae bacterium CFX9]|nr:1,4-alpha-glucan branching protein GlgB [Anaerolineae bacterium CFX9]
MQTSTVSNIHPDALNALCYGDHGAPFQILGAHQIDPEHISVRALRPNAREMHLVNDASGDSFPMTKHREQGFFEVTLPGSVIDFQYHFIATTYDDRTEHINDPYAIHAPLLTEFDLYLFGEGRLLYSYEKFGAHLREVNGIAGVNFCVWAPNARRVSVVGNFNDWDNRVHPMQMNGSSGVWELFIPGIGEHEIYRFDIRSHHMGYTAQKSDPYGFFSEVRPANASVVFDINNYTWNDQAWLEERAARSALSQPMAIYEVHLGSWRRHDDGTWLTYRELAHQLVDYVKYMGFNYIELLPVSEHPFDGSWGYQVTGYYAPTSRYGTPTDFMYFVDHCYQNGIGVILDWVPAHFPKDGHALSYFDGTHLYEHEDARKGEHPDWGTYIFNYGRNEVRNFLVSNALYWTKHFHIDGLRVDAVSSMLYLNYSRKEGEWQPNQYGGNENLEALAFIRETNQIVHTECPGAFTIAEESTAWPMVSRPTYIGGLGFTFKWNMGWMHDTLKYMQLDPIYRKYHHNDITFSLLYAFTENFILSLSHDEVVHGKGSLMGKMSGDWWQKFANLRLLLGYMFTHPGKKLLFMGQEFGQWNEWSEARALDWNLLDLETHQRLQHWMRSIAEFYRAEPALYELDFDGSGYQWSVVTDWENSTFAYIRYANDRSNFIVVVTNYTPVPRYDYMIGVPQGGRYAEVLNSDAVEFGGSGVRNGELNAEEGEFSGLTHRLRLTVPPLGIVILKPQA